LRLAATLLEDPYDEFDVITPFTLKVPVAPPPFLEKWRAAMIGALALSSIAALLWYFRDRSRLAGDLRYAIAAEASSAPLAACTAEERPTLAWLFGVSGAKPIVAPGGDRTLARIEPADGDLFRLRPARGVQVEAPGRDETIPFQDGAATLAVHRIYRLRGRDGAYLFRTEYE
jgi:hypothetical protein